MSDAKVSSLPAAGVRRAGRQRRPTGAPPPLPWRPTLTTTAWLLLAAITMTSAFLVSEQTPWRRAGEQASTWLLQQLARARTPWLTHVANGINVAGLDWHAVIGWPWIRNLWDAGLAHRDIKPGNLMVGGGQLLLIDVAFVQVRPSPWRRAVDLGNMLLVLAARTSPGRVYRRALNLFTPDELAEAFAATRGVAIPAQLRAFLRRDPRDLLGEFRALAPPRPPIAVQRWGLRRVAFAAAVLAATATAVWVSADAYQPAGVVWAYPPSAAPVTR